MNEADQYHAVSFARERLRTYGCMMLEGTDLLSVYHHNPGPNMKFPLLNGDPMILFTKVSGDDRDPYDIQTWPVDLSLSMGQFIDGLNTMLAIKYGPLPAPDSYDPRSGTINAGIILGAKTLRASSGAHSHQISAVNADPNARMREHLENIVLDPAVSVTEKAQAAHALTSLSARHGLFRQAITRTVQKLSGI